MDAPLPTLRRLRVRLPPWFPEPLDAAAVPSPTTVAGFLDQAARLAGRPMVHCSQEGAWPGFTWRQARDRALRIACGLVSAGVAPGERVVVLSEDRPDAVCVQLAVQMAGAVPTVIAPTARAGVAQAIAGDCGAVLAVASGEALASRLHLTVSLGRIIRLDGEVARWSRAELEKASYAEVISRLRRLDPGGVATLGHLQADDALVPLTHRRLVGAAQRLAGALGMGAADRVLAVLPPEQVIERVLVVTVAIAAGATLWLARPVDVPSADVGTLQPTVLLAVPRLLRELGDRARRQAAGHPLVRWRLDRAIQMRSRELSEAWSGCRPGIVDRLALAGVRRRVGGRRLHVILTPERAGPEADAFLRAIRLPVELLDTSELKEPVPP